MITFKSNAHYSDGQSVNEVINVLQNKYGFLNKFEQYVLDNMSRFNLQYKKNFPYAKFNNFLSQLFREYIIHKSHGIHYKNNGMIEFIDTGLLVTTVKLTFINEEISDF